MRQSTAPTPRLAESVRLAWRLLLIIRPFWRSLLAGIAFGIALGLIGLLPPYLTKLFIDEVYPSRNVSLMHALVLVVLAVGVGSALFGAVRSYYTQVIGAQLNAAVTLMFFNHVQHLPIRFFDTRSIGDVTSRFADLRSSVAGITGAFQTLLSSGTYLLIVPPVLFLLNWQLALVALIAVPFTVTISLVSGGAARRFWRESAEAGAELSAFHIEVLSHARTLKTFGAEHFLFRRANGYVRASTEAQLKATALAAALSLLNGMLRLASMALFTWYGWTLILNGSLSLGEFIAFSAYLGYLTRPIASTASLFGSFQRTAVSLARAFEVLDETPERPPATAYRSPPPIAHRLQGRIELRDVAFAYEAERPVLTGVSLAIEPGTIVALVGASGAGKSTVLRLLCRLLEPSAGTVEFDGVPSRDVSQLDVRRQVAVVWQEVSLLRGTLWDTLTYGLDDPDARIVAEAVRCCRLDTFVASLPLGLQTPIAEWGATLSGGQRQRVAIARALVRRAPVLLLDEATANVDLATEAEILGDLAAMRDRHTIVFVTHRVSTARIADQVCLVSGGRVTACGTHDELLATSEEYAALAAPSAVRAPALEPFPIGRGEPARAR